MGFRDRLLNGQEFFQHGAQFGGFEGIGAVGLRFLGIVVDLHEYAVHAGGDGSAGEKWDEFGLPAADGVVAFGGSGGELDRMGCIENHWRELAHDGQRAHIDDQVVVAEAGAALGDEDAIVAGRASFLNHVLHVPGGEELAFLDVHGAFGHRGGDYQVGLAAEERRDLQHVGYLGDFRDVLGVVHVGEDGNVDLVLDLSQDAETLGEAWSAKAPDRSAVCLIVRSLKDERHVKRPRYALDDFSHEDGVLFAFDDAGPGDQEELAGPNIDAVNLE